MRAIFSIFVKFELLLLRFIWSISSLISFMQSLILAGKRLGWGTQSDFSTKSLLSKKIHHRFCHYIKWVIFSLLPNSSRDLEITSSLILGGLGTKDTSSPFDERLVSFCPKVPEERFTIVWDFFSLKGYQFKWYSQCLRMAWAVEDVQ